MNEELQNALMVMKYLRASLEHRLDVNNVKVNDLEREVTDL